MTSLTDHLTKLVCAAQTARDHGYLHTSRAFDRMIADEKRRLKLARSEQCGAVSPPHVTKQLA